MTALWDPVEVLSLKQQQDGHFTCSGVKNNTTEPCGFHLKGPIVSEINCLLDEMSAEAPQNANPNDLTKLAKATLCHWHQKAQVRTKVSEWTNVIRALPRQTYLTPVSSPPIPPSTSNSGSSAPEVVKYPPLGTSNNAAEERLRAMQEEIDSLKEQIDRLEIKTRERDTSTPVKESRSSSWSRILPGKRE